MRTARIKEDGDGYYHVLSRVVDRRMLINDREKERFCGLMRDMEGFSSVQVLAFSCLDNHFHIELHVPDREEVTDSDLIRRLGCLYDKKVVKTAEEHLRYLREVGQDQAAELFKAKYTYRMYDLSEFMKTLKQRYTQSFNRRHGRKGTLWEERFKSLLIGGSAGALSAVAAYIDLNAVRAGIVKDPKDYRFCGYGEAVAGSKRARRGLGHVMASLGCGCSWNKVSAEYRKFLYITGETDVETGTRAGFCAEKVKAVQDAGGQLSMGELLRCRVRYFTDGAVLGSREYVEKAFMAHRDHFGLSRTTGARAMAVRAWPKASCCDQPAWGDLCTARRLRLAVVTLPKAA